MKTKIKGMLIYIIYTYYIYNIYYYIYIYPGFQVELNMNIVLLSIKNTILTENLDSNFSQDILIKNQYILHPMKVDFYINNSILKNKIQSKMKNQRFLSVKILSLILLVHYKYY